MFWNKKDPCFHEYRVSDIRFDSNFMGDSDVLYEIICINCKKKRTLSEYDYKKMDNLGFILKS